jgi:hypothetical protein
MLIILLTFEISKQIKQFKLKNIIMKKSINYLNSIDSATKAGFLFLTLIIFPLIIAVSLKIISGATLHY